MQPLLMDAFARDTGADDLGQAVVIQRPQAEPRLDRGAHLLCPGLGAEHPGLEPQHRRVDALLGGGLGDQQGVGGRAAQHRAAEILHDLHLAPGIATRDWDDRGADARGAIVEA